MPRFVIGPDHVTLRLSANDTYNWANKPGAKWPCSQLEGRRLVASFDTHGLNGMSVDGGRGNQDIDSDEFNAITSDFLRDRLPKDHPAYFVTVTQFELDDV